MSARQFLDSGIVNQNRIKRELSIYLEEMREGRNLNLFLRAPSGHGKNLFADAITTFLGSDDSVLYIGEEVFDEFFTDLRIHILDEIHEIKTPEPLYPLMDSGEYTFILLTNEYDSLKEPLENRCIPLTFDEYTQEDLALIIWMEFLKWGMDISPEFCSEISNSSRNTPRIAKLLARRLSMVFKQSGIPINIENLRIEMQETLNVYQDGSTELDRRYLNFLQQFDHPVGLNTIVYTTGIRKSTIRQEIEPFLIRKGLLEITPSGRRLREHD